MSCKQCVKELFDIRVINVPIDGSLLDFFEYLYDEIKVLISDIFKFRASNENAEDVEEALDLFRNLKQDIAAFIETQREVYDD